MWWWRRETSRELTKGLNGSRRGAYAHTTRHAYKIVVSGSMPAGTAVSLGDRLLQSVVVRVPLQLHTDGQEIAAALGSCMSAPTSMAIQSSLQVGIQRRAARGEKVGGEKMVARFQIRDEGAWGGGGGCINPDL